MHNYSLKVGIIGLGNMGGGFAKNLLSRGYVVNAYDISEQAVLNILKLGGIKANNPRDVAQKSDIIITSLPDSNTVRNIYLGDNGIIDDVSNGKIAIDTSTVDVHTEEEIYNEIKKRGGEFLVITIGKGPAQAEKGESPLFIGGDEATVNKIEEFLNDFGGKRYYLGSIRNAVMFKLLSNVIGLGNLAILTEAFNVAKTIGLDVNQFYEALKDTGAASYQLDLRLPWIVNNDFTSRFSLKHTRKDIYLALSYAEELKIPMPIASIILHIYTMAEREGLGNLDACALIKLYEKWIEGE